MKTCIYCDTSVFIALRELSPADPIQVALVELFSIDNAQDSPFLKTSLLTTAELMVKPFKDKNVDLEIFYRGISVSNSFLEIGPLTHDIMLNAAQLRAKYSSLKLPDALHLATGLAFGCSHFLTGDNRLLHDYEIEFRHSHPFYTGFTNYTGFTKDSGKIAGIELSQATLAAFIEELKR
jgi:uncharacterized protein